MPRTESCSSMHRGSLAGAVLVAASLLSSLPTFAFAQTDPSCELRILGESDAAEAYEDVRATLVEPGPSQRQVIAESAPYLTPLHCRSAEKVAFVADPGDESGTMGWVYVSHDNDTLYVDARPARASEADLDPTRRPRAVGMGVPYAADDLPRITFRADGR